MIGSRQTQGDEELAYRARGTELLRESLALGDCGESAWATSIVGERLHVNRGGTVVVNDGILGRSQAEKGTKGDEGKLHCVYFCFRFGGEEVGISVSLGTWGGTGGLHIGLRGPHTVP